MFNKEIKKTIHYQIQYFDRKSMAWIFDNKNYQTLEQAKIDCRTSKTHRYAKVTMPKNIIEIIK